MCCNLALYTSYRNFAYDQNYEARKNLELNDVAMRNVLEASRSRAGKIKPKRRGE